MSLVIMVVSSVSLSWEGVWEYCSLLFIGTGDLNELLRRVIPEKIASEN